MNTIIYVTKEQSIKAVNIISDIITEVFPDDKRYMATQIMLNYDMVKDMYDLIKEINENERPV